MVCDALRALVSVERHVRREVKALNGVPIVTAVRQRVEYFIAIKLPVRQQIYQFEHIARPSAFGLRICGVTVKASVQDHIPERSYVVITRVEYASPESGLYRFLKEVFVHNVLTPISVTRSASSTTTEQSNRGWNSARPTFANAFGCNVAVP